MAVDHRIDEGHAFQSVIGNRQVLSQRARLAAVMACTDRLGKSGIEVGEGFEIALGVARRGADAHLRIGREIVRTALDGLVDGLLDPQEFMGDWLDNGGDAVILEADPGCTARKLVDLAEIARAAFDPAFLTAMTSGPTYERAGELLLVHAGLAPGVDAENFLGQGRFGSSGEHWAWIRDPFLDWEFGWGPDRSWVVVHGHTPAVTRRAGPDGFARAADRVGTHRRLCLDAGAAYGLPQVGWAEFGPDRYRVGLARPDV